MVGKIIVDTLTLTNGDPNCLAPKIHDLVIYYTYNLPALYHFDKTFLRKSGSEISLTMPKVNSVYIRRLHDRLSHNPHAESMNILDLRRTALGIKNRPISCVSSRSFVVQYQLICQTSCTGMSKPNIIDRINFNKFLFMEKVVWHMDNAHVWTQS